MSQKCTPLWREAHFQVKMHKTHHVRTIFGGSDVVSRGRRKGLCTLSKVTKRWGFCSISKNDGRHGTFEEDLQRYIFRGRRSTMQSIDWLKNLALKFSVIVVAMATSIGPLGFKGWHQQKADGDAGNPRLGWQDGLDEKAQGTCFCLRRH